MQRPAGPVREGSALLQGRVLCGPCGERMGVHYSQEHGQPVPTYVCQETATAVAARSASPCPAKSSTRYKSPLDDVVFARRSTTPSIAKV
ncbi:zinc ribbon domain-containing protein [Mesorhizobium sp. ORM16]|uniref:zinc ribbon domain-containing protein n=1 Tax=Mesorhizobium sp. ORM16 TaxID=3376989 RepID=UPI003857BF04